MEQIETDFLVAGSGAGGMVGAITAHELGMNTLIVEKSQYYGGSSAMSGGGIWAPNNPTLKRNGIIDDFDEVVFYLKRITENKVPEAKLKTFVEESPLLFEMLEKKSDAMQFSYCKGYSDYHPEYRGARGEGRSIEPLPFNLKRLKKDAKFIHPTNLAIPKGFYLTSSEFKEMCLIMRTWKGKKIASKAMARMLKNIILRKDVQALGLALIGRLRKVLQECKIPLWLNSPVKELIKKDEKIIGTIVEKESKQIKIIAKKGVLLATGGFENNLELRKKYLPKLGHENYSTGAEENQGDGQILAESIGADLELMEDAWWMPSIQLPSGIIFPLVAERGIPRSIIVGSNGKRFTNEANPYVNFVHDQIALNEKRIWQILDQKAFNRYMYGGKPPVMPFDKDFFKQRIVAKASSLESLAKKIGIDVDQFINEVKKYNNFAKAGSDLDFKKGDNPYDRYYGDPTLKNPTVDAIKKAPFYAIKVRIGDLGTKGGVKTDEFARALRPDNSVLEGLYATGNASGSVMGRDYAGAGATIGPSMVFGYIAAKNAQKKS